MFKGVKVYVKFPGVEVFMVAGDQVPATSFVDVVGGIGGTAPWQRLDVGLNVGTVRGFTVIVIASLS